MNISAIVMASGFSKRMGENKLKLEVKGKRMFEYTVDLLDSLDFSEKILVTNDEDIKKYAEGKLKVYDNENADVGKSESIRIGVENSGDVDGYMFFVCDQPFVSEETVRKILDKFYEDELITFPMYGKKRGAPMIFPKSFKDGLLNLKEDEGGVVLISDENSQKVDIESEMEHIDIDTREQYEKIR